MERVRRYLAAAILICGLLVPGMTSAAQNVDPGNWGKNSPGVELATHEDPRQRTSSATVLMYNLLGKGFPPDKVYDLWLWGLGKQPQKALTGLSFDKRGLLVCSGKPGLCKGQGTDDPVNIKATAALGEPKRFGVVSTDGKVAGFIEAVPFPIEARDNNCKLFVVRQSLPADSVVIRGIGFVPHEVLAVKVHLAGQDLSRSPTVADDGTWQQAVEMKTPGQTSGTATIDASGKSCSVTVKFDWGEASNKKQ